MTRGEALGVEVRLSITTNGTLIDAGDVEFFEQHGFAVTISIDGDRDSHDALRPFRQRAWLVRPDPGPGSSAAGAAAAHAGVGASHGHARQPRECDEIVEHLLALGFHSVGVSPMLSSPTGAGEVGPAELSDAARSHDRCRPCLRTSHLGRRALRIRQRRQCDARDRPRHPPPVPVRCRRRISRGCRRWRPVRVPPLRRRRSRADGARSTPASTPTCRATWLRDRHVHRQEPCRSCWARYLCGGGCHHEVVHRGRPACDYIRGWLEYCIGAYARLTGAGVTFSGDGLQ